ncbi:hypothetical protein DENSPDRAFT_838882 [Dentipellis sp. KUC8613]|nr:hypothetical protein DENSPDRAFT_838882 [Dentipellis sp. KUC8613]
MGQWTSPPTRRELSLLVFCVAIFILAYNIDASLRLVGLSAPHATLSAPIGPDGRRPEAYRDGLEDEIFGEWDWEAGRIAGVKAAEETRIKGAVGKAKGWGSSAKGWEDRYVHGEGLTGRMAMWLQGVGEGRYGQLDAELGLTSVNDESLKWGENVPRTTVVKHVPGYTILDNVMFAFGTLFVVSDEPDSMPPAEELGSSLVDHSQPPRDIDWQILPGWNALSKLGTYGGRIHGVTLMSYDDPQSTDARTILALQRLYSTLNDSSTPLSPPHRLVFPSVPTFSDKKPDPDDGAIPRRRSSVGIHPYTFKAAYPSLAGALFSEDYDDFVGMNTPVMFDRLVIADRGASARRGGDWARPFTDMQADVAWFEPARRAMEDALALGEAERGRAGLGKEVTYLVNQRGLGLDAGVRPAGRLRDEDHKALLEALKGLRRSGVHVNVIEETTPWAERMRAVVRSAVTIGTFGDHLSDAVFMRPSLQTTLIELFPSGTYIRDWQVVMRSMGHNYIAFQSEQKFSGDSMPAVSLSNGEDVHIDAKAVVRAIKEELARR